MAREVLHGWFPLVTYYSSETLKALGRSCNQRAEVVVKLYQPLAPRLMVRFAANGLRSAFDLRRYEGPPKT